MLQPQPWPGPDYRLFDVPPGMANQIAAWYRQQGGTREPMTNRVESRSRVETGTDGSQARPVKGLGDGQGVGIDLDH